MDELFDLMTRQHGVATTTQARALGIDRRVERHLIATGALDEPFPGVLTAGGAEITFTGRAMAAALSPGVVAVAHGAAARLHGLRTFADHEAIDVIGVNGAATADARLGTTFHTTRGPVLDYVVRVEGIPVLSLPLTLALLAPVVGIGPTGRAVDDALRLGVDTASLKGVAQSWRVRGRAGPPALLMLLGERVDKRPPRSWFQRLAARVLARRGIHLRDEYPVLTDGGVLLAELDLADPVRRVGVECQSWEWHASPTAQHRDARRRGSLRQLGWEIVDVWWSDLKAPDRVFAELDYLLRTRTPVLQ